MRKLIPIYCLRRYMNKIKLDENIEIVHNSRNVMTVYVSNVKTGFNLSVLARGDAHHDNTRNDRVLEKEHLDEAVDKNALIFDVGDLFCAMNGKYDPRRSYSDMRPEYVVDNYLDAIVEDAAKFYGPYANRFLMIGQGNHESSILKNNGVDLTNNLVHRLNTDYKSHIQRGGYGGYIRFIFNSGKSQSKIIKYFHGYLGNQSVNAIQRQATIYPDADVIINGDTHEAWYYPIARETISDRGVVSKKLQHHVRTASYKDDYLDGNDGWWVEKGGKPKPLGAVWINFEYKNHDIEIEVKQDVK
jgi:hypothetical protein